MGGGRRLALSFAVRSLRRRSALNILPSSSYAAIHLTRRPKRGKSRRFRLLSLLQANLRNLALPRSWSFAIVVCLLIKLPTSAAQITPQKLPVKSWKSWTSLQIVGIKHFSLVSG
ncbi:hypothetical protein CY35_09G108800 [Sphagnum magellanicum]|nr:hypothetical protein CY35_09G108800 [Sphagnum magellanicum]